MCVCVCVSESMCMCVCEMVIAGERMCTDLPSAELRSMNMSVPSGLRKGYDILVNSGSASKACWTRRLNK